MIELHREAEDQDIESLQPLRRGMGWMGSWKFHQTSTQLSTEDANIRTLASYRSIGWIAKWFADSKQSVDKSHETVPLHVFSDASHNIQTRFIVAIMGQEPCEQLTGACTWYMEFLEFKVREAWATLFVPVVRGSNSAGKLGNALSLSNEDMFVAFHILHTIVGQLGRENLALTDIVDNLYNTCELKETDDERSHANQLVLASLGWISSLFSARHNPEPMKLQITPPGSSISGSEGPAQFHHMRRRALRNTFTNFSQTLENNDQPLHTVLSQFGRIIPQQHTICNPGDSSSSYLAPARRDEEWIELSLVCFHTLNRVANIKIEWVDVLSLHLEFDSFTKVLKVFRLPSLCLVMSCCEKVSPLSQLFSDAMEFNSITSEPIDASDFHREVLLSYRLIFGQDAASCSDFLKLTQQSPLPIAYQDPVLPTLCGAHWESPEAKRVYTLISADYPSPQYSALTYFPFLGKRLLDIQTYVKGHNPNSLRSIWHDKRNPSEWWTFWAVLFFGCVTLILTMIFGLLQTILAGYQVYYARLQVHNSP